MAAAAARAALAAAIELHQARPYALLPGLLTIDMEEVMRSFLVLSLTAALSSGVLAQSDQDHAAYHPDGASAPAAAASKAPAKAAATGKPASAPASTPMGMGNMHDQMHGTSGKPSAQAKPSGKSKAAPASSPMGMDDMQQMHEQMHGKPTNGATKSTTPAPAGSATKTMP